MMIDPNESQYQVSSLYLPDKEPLWKHTTSRHSWLYIINSLRGEIDAIQTALDLTVHRQKPLLQWEINSIQSVISQHFEHMLSHHHVLDFLMTSETNKRFCLHGKFESLHDNLQQKVKLVEIDLQSNLISGKKISKENHLRHWIEYKEMALAYLIDEEQSFLPMIRSFYTPEEYYTICRSTINNLEKTELGSFIHFMEKKRFRNEYMKQEGIWFFLWYFKFSMCLTQFKEVFLVHIDALSKGTRPKICCFKNNKRTFHTALSASFHGSTSSYCA